LGASRNWRTRTHEPKTNPVLTRHVKRRREKRVRARHKEERAHLEQTIARNAQAATPAEATAGASEQSGDRMQAQDEEESWRGADLITHLSQDDAEADALAGV